MQKFQTCGTRRALPLTRPGTSEEKVIEGAWLKDVLVKLQITTQDQRMDFNPRILESPGMVVWEDNAIEYQNELHQNTHTHTPRLHGFSRYIRKRGKGKYGSKYEIYCPTRLFRFGKVLMALELPFDFFSFKILSIFIYPRDFYSNSFRYLCIF